MKIITLKNTCRIASGLVALFALSSTPLLANEGANEASLKQKEPNPLSVSITNGLEKALAAAASAVEKASPGNTPPGPPITPPGQTESPGGPPVTPPGRDKGPGRPDIPGPPPEIIIVSPSKVPPGLQ